MQPLSTFLQLPEAVYGQLSYYNVAGHQVLQCMWESAFACLSHHSVEADIILLVLFYVSYMIFRSNKIHLPIWQSSGSPGKCCEVEEAKSPSAEPEVVLEDETTSTCRKHSSNHVEAKVTISAEPEVLRSSHPHLLQRSAMKKAQDEKRYGPRPRCRALCAQNAGQPPDLPEACTTVVLKNIPKDCTPDALLACLHEGGYFGEIDFVYIPLDFKQGNCSMGCAILNFRNVIARGQFAAEFHMADARDKMFDTSSSSPQLLQVASAGIQGYSENAQRLQKSPVLAWLARYPEWLPRMVDGGGLAMPLKALRRSKRCRPVADAA